MKEDILNFEVRFYSQDGQNSPVKDYLVDLNDINPELAKEAMKDIYYLPKHIFLQTKSVKYFKVGTKRFCELRVKHKNNICRFFFILENPNLIIFYGFIKKTQKTEEKDKKLGVKYLKEYEQNPRSISLKSLGSLL